MNDVVRTKIDFMGQRKIWSVISIIAVLLSIVCLATKGLALGLDFTGGSVIELRYEEPPALSEIRTTLEAADYEGVVVQNFGTDTAVVIRMADKLDEQGANEVLNSLRADGSNPSLQRVEFVGSQVGDNLREQAGLALLLAMFAILVYVGFRFQFKFGIAAIVPLVHDVLVTLGFFSFFQWTFDLTVLAAVLAVIGYSINDTIVICDRIRENFRRARQGTPSELINSSINQTLARTFMTSGTTLVTLICLLIFGGEMIRGFSLALVIGIIVGTYSSIYITASLLMTLKVSREDLMIPIKEGSGGKEEDESPPEWLNRM